MILENFHEPNFKIYSLDPNQDTEVWHLDKYYISISQWEDSHEFVTFSSNYMKEFYCDSSFGILFKGEKLIVGSAEYTKIFEENLPDSLVQKFFKLHHEGFQRIIEKFDKEGKAKKVNEAIDLALSSIVKERIPEHCI